MKAVRTKKRTLRADERGATAVEYGLIAALIVVAMVGGLSQMGGGTIGMWSMINNKVQNS